MGCRCMVVMGPLEDMMKGSKDTDSVFFLKTDHQLFQKANKVKVQSELGQPTALKKEREKKNSILDTANKEKANRTQPGNTKEK